MSVQRVTVNIPQPGNSTLEGWLERPVGPSHGVVLLAHSWGNPKHSLASTYICQQLCRNGWSVLRFDSPQGDASQGPPNAENLHSRVQEIASAASWLEATLMAPTLLVGLGLGGTAALLYSHAIADCRAVATWGAPASSELIPDTVQSLASVKKPTLILHAAEDACVAFSEAERLRAGISAPCNLIALDNMTHQLESRQDADYVAGLIHAWAVRYRPETALVRGLPSDVSRGQVRVLEANHAFLRDIRTDHHAWQADEPLSAGGSDQGPDPYELLLSALGACTSMTMRMYANRKGLRIDHLQVDLKHERRHRDDCEDCEGQGGQLDVITRTLHIEGDLTDSERQRLTEIADRCPVHRTLENQPVIRTALIPRATTPPYSSKASSESGETRR